MYYNFTISCRVCVFNFPETEGGVHAPKAPFQRKNIFEEHWSCYRDFTDSAIQPILSINNKQSMRAWPPRPIMNSTQTHLDSRRNQNGQVLCSMIWLFVSTDVQLVSDISNTTASEASFAWVLKPDKLEYEDSWSITPLWTLSVYCSKQPPDHLKVSAS